MGLIDDIGPGRVAVNTAIFIYYIEEEPRFLPLLAPLFEDVDAGRRERSTSALTLLEVLVVPMDITRDQLRAAAQLRAVTGMKTPDALQIAAALGARCRTFLTDDRALPPVPGLRILQLSSYD